MDLFLPEVFYEEGVLKNSAKIRGEHLCQNLFFYKFYEIFKNTFLKKPLHATASALLASSESRFIVQENM